MYTKSILRGLIIDGGVSITDPVRLRDLLAEQAQRCESIGKMGTIGGGVSIALGLLIASINPGALIAAASGAYAIYLGQRNKPTNAEEREFRFLSRHGRIINLLGQFAQAGAGTDDEILSAYESLCMSYLPLSDQIAIDGVAVSASEMLGQLPQVIEAQRKTVQTPAPLGSQPITARKSMLPPSRLNENALSQSGLGVAVNPWGQMQQHPQTMGNPTESTGATVATLNRTLQQPAPIGLPQALADVTVGKPYSTFIIGMSEAGKDILLYNIAVALKGQYPTALFVGIDGKNHAGERPLWSEQIYDRTLHISMLDMPSEYHHRLADLLKFACQFPGMVFVNFSELNGIAGSYKAHGMKDEWGEISHYLRYLALQGNAAQKYLLSTAQGLTLDELGITTSTRGNIQFLMVGNATQFGFINSITANTTVFDRKLISNQNAFTAACSRSTALEHLPVASTLKGVAWFHTALNRWEPMPRLVNPGHDRSLPQATEPPMVAPTFEPTDYRALPVTPGFEAVPPTPEPEQIDDTDWEESEAIEAAVDAAYELLKDQAGQAIAWSKLGFERNLARKHGPFLEECLKELPGVQYSRKQQGNQVIRRFWYEP